MSTEPSTTEKPTCACGSGLSIVAHGKCRRCYDRDRHQTDPAAHVEHHAELSDAAIAVLRVAVEHKRKHREHPSLADLERGLPAMEQGAVAAAAFECIRKHAASFRFAPKWADRR